MTVRNKEIPPPRSLTANNPPCKMMFVRKTIVSHPVRMVFWFQGEHIFQMGWFNHQLESRLVKYYTLRKN